MCAHNKLSNKNIIFKDFKYIISEKYGLTKNGLIPLIHAP